MNKKILLCSCSITVQRVINWSLSGEGFNILEAKDTKETKDILKGSIPDLLIVDQDFSKSGGIALSKELKSSEKYAHIPIILLFRKPDIDDGKEDISALIKECKADKILNVPFDSYELEKMAKALLAPGDTEKVKPAGEKVIPIADSGKLSNNQPDEKKLKKETVLGSETDKENRPAVEEGTLEGIPEVRSEGAPEGKSEGASKEIPKGISEAVPEKKLEGALEDASAEGLQPKEVKRQDYRAEELPLDEPLFEDKSSEAQRPGLKGKVKEEYKEKHEAEQKYLWEPETDIQEGFSKAEPTGFEYFLAVWIKDIVQREAKKITEKMIPDIIKEIVQEQLGKLIDKETLANIINQNKVYISKIMAEDAPGIVREVTEKMVPVITERIVKEEIDKIKSGNTA